MFYCANAQTTTLPHKMMGGDEVEVLLRSTPPHFAVNVMQIMARSVLAHTLVETQLLVRHNEPNSQIWCAL